MPKNTRQKILKENLLNQTLEGDLITTAIEATPPAIITPEVDPEMGEEEGFIEIISREIILETVTEALTTTPLGITTRITKMTEIILITIQKDITVNRIISGATKAIEAMVEAEEPN